MSAMNRRMASRRAKDRHWALLGAVVAGMGLASQVHAQDVPDVPVVRTATLAGFLPAADPGLEFVDAASAMPADFIRQSLPDALGRQWLNVSRTYWSFPPIPGLGALPPESSGLLAVPENVLHHIEAAFMAHPGGAGTAAGLGVSASLTALSILATPFIAIPLVNLVALPVYFVSYVGSLVATPLAGGAGGLANALIDYAPGVPPVYQVSIDYFKVGTLQPAISEAVHGALDPLTDPLRATLRSAADQVLNPVKDAVSGATGSACRLVYTEAVNLSSGDAAQASWPPAVETGFDCGGVMNRRMCIDVGAGFAGGAGADATPMKCDPLSSRLLESGGIDFGPGMITWLGDAEGAGVLPILFDPSQEGAGMIPILFDPTKSQLFDMFLPYTVAIGWPAESLVVSIDSVKSSEDLHRLAQSIDYRGLCLAVHPDGEGCPSQ